MSVVTADSGLSTVCGCARPARAGDRDDAGVSPLSPLDRIAITGQPAVVKRVKMQCVLKPRSVCVHVQMSLCM